MSHDAKNPACTTHHYFTCLIRGYGLITNIYTKTPLSLHFNMKCNYCKRDKYELSVNYWMEWTVVIVCIAVVSIMVCLPIKFVSVLYSNGSSVKQCSDNVYTVMLIDLTNSIIRAKQTEIAPLWIENTYSRKTICSYDKTFFLLMMWISSDFKSMHRFWKQLVQLWFGFMEALCENRFHQTYLLYILNVVIN